ncbi:MAG: hypothetical protein QXL94_05285 [Candidatus Parvarchaeum sp.]
MVIMRNRGFVSDFNVKIVNFIKNSAQNLEFFEEKVYKEDIFLYMARGE